MNSKPNPAVAALRRYYFEMSAALVLYLATIFTTRSLWHRYQDSPGRFALALIPVVPVILMFTAMVRFVLHTDEFQRKVAVESLALAGGITALLACSYGLMEGDGGLPRVSAWWTYTVFMASWIICSKIVRRSLK